MKESMKKRYSGHLKVREMVFSTPYGTELALNPMMALIQLWTVRLDPISLCNFCPVGTRDACIRHVSLTTTIVSSYPELVAYL